MAGELDNRIRIRRDHNGKVWSWFDDLFMEKYAKFFGPTGIAIYMNLCRRVDKKQYCYPSEKTIANDIRSSDRTVRDYLKAFRKHNIIIYQRKKKKEGGKFEHNEYYLLDKSVWILPKEIITFGKNKRSKILCLPEEINHENHGRLNPHKKLNIKKDNFVNKDPPSKEGLELEGEIKKLADSKQIK